MKKGPVFLAGDLHPGMFIIEKHYSYWVVAVEPMEFKRVHLTFFENQIATGRSRLCRMTWDEHNVFVMRSRRAKFLSLIKVGDFELEPAYCSDTAHSVSGFGQEVEENIGWPRFCLRGRA